MKQTIKPMIKRLTGLFIVLCLSVGFDVSYAQVINEHEEVVISDSRKFEEQSGEQLYYSVCQGCHMSNGQGAKGAAQYPALANNTKLVAALYPTFMVLKGKGAMPGFAKYMDDKQIAEVVNYVRSHFGNQYADKIDAEDVKAMR